MYEKWSASTGIDDWVGEATTHSAGILHGGSRVGGGSSTESGDIRLTCTKGGIWRQ